MNNVIWYDECIEHKHMNKYVHIDVLTQRQVIGVTPTHALIAPYSTGLDSIFDRMAM